jgi:hypothetical protein
MKNEADFKKAFCESVAEQGGYTFKIAMSMMNGLPDIYCAMPCYVPVLLEAKWIRDCGPTFKKKIPYRPMQREILSSANKVYPRPTAGFGLIGIEYFDGNKYCLLMEPLVEIVTHKDILNDSVKIVNNQIDVGHLFYKSVMQL